MSGGVPMLDLADQYRPLRDELLAVLERALDKGAFILGNEVQELEFAVADRVGSRHAIACASGTDALLLALMALRVGPGDAVITTPYSFFATVSCITRLGARPLLVDIEPETFNIDPAGVRHLLEHECDRTGNGLVHRETGTRVRAIIPVHLFGQCADMTVIGAAAREFGLAIVEDAAQALGARWGECGAGAMGDIGCFSFYPAKNLGALGDGGMMTTSDDEHAEMLRKLRVHGARPKYVHHVVGLNSRLDAIQAGFLRVLLPHLPAWEAARRSNAATYTEAFAALDGIAPPAERPEGHHVYNQYVIRSPRRDNVQDYLTSKGIGTALYYPIPLHLQECFADLGYREGDFPESERASRESLALPVGPALSEEQLAAVITAVREVSQ